MLRLASLALLLVPRQAVEHGLESFDLVWKTVADTHFDPTFHGVDWAGVRDELRPRAEAAKDLAELRQVVRDMLARLGQSHFELITKEAMGTGAAGSEESPAGTIGLDLRWLADEAIVVRVEPESPAESAGIHPGWKLLELGGADLSGILARARAEASLRYETAVWTNLTNAVDGAVGSKGAFQFEEPGGARRTLELERIERRAEPFDMPGLPTMFLRSRWDVFEEDERSIGLLFFSNWFRPLLEELDEALVEMRGCDGIVLDLRGNTGGDGGLTVLVAGHFFDVRSSLGLMRRRDGDTEFTVLPRKSFPSGPVEPYSGPLAILVDDTSCSSSEVFAGGMQAAGRARVFGTRSAGAALPAVMTRLPDGDSLLHAIAEFVTPRGDRLEGGGVTPDVVCAPTRADWAAGKDLALAAAVQWIVHGE